MGDGIMAENKKKSGSVMDIVIMAVMALSAILALIEVYNNVVVAF